VSFSELQELFRDERKWLSRNCLVAVAGGSTDGTSGFQEDDSFAAFREELERFAHIIFSATPKQRDYWLGKLPGFSKETIEGKYGALKPCMHGSDAHRSEKVGAHDKNRYCWLKGDLAFETIRQAVLEPEYRVSCGEFAPLGPSPSETVDHVKLTKAPFVATPALPVNAGLVAIIGARGSGKTALMEFLAAGASALTSTAKESSFLQRAGGLLYGFRAVYVFDRLSRDLRPSLCVLDGFRLCHSEAPLDSSRHIIAQLLCSVQRCRQELQQGRQTLKAARNHSHQSDPGLCGPEAEIVAAWGHAQ
jgi:hypothetical protein